MTPQIGAAAVFTVTADTNGMWVLDTTTATPTLGSLPAGGYPQGSKITISAQVTKDSSISTVLNMGYRHFMTLNLP